MRRLRRLLIAAIAVATTTSFTGVAARANWLTHILKEGGEAGSTSAKLGKLGVAGLDDAANLVAKLPATADGLPLAAHVTAEGHWTFVSKAGETFTAGTAEELARVTKALAPEAAADSKLVLYLSEETVFRERLHLSALPAGAELHVVAGSDAFRLVRRTGVAGEDLLAEVKPNIVVVLKERALFDEAVHHLDRPLNRSNMRVLALEPGGPKTLSSIPGFDKATKTPLVDTIDPGAAAASLWKLKGQTVLVAGRVEGDILHFSPSAGGAGRLNITELSQAAETYDVNLVILQSSAGRQPGGRNWLWQKVEVTGLEDGLKRATFGDFLSAVSAGRGELAVAAQTSSPGRIMLTAMPSGNSAVPLTDSVTSWLSETTNHALGHIVTTGVQVFARDQYRESELDARIIPGIPSWLQYTYLAGIILGLLGFDYTFPWWARLWPHEQRGEYSSSAGFNLARAVRQGAFYLVFLPIAGIPAFTLGFLGHLWYQIKAPLRWMQSLRAKFSRQV